jgi:hypothetical protein
MTVVNDILKFHLWLPIWYYRPLPIEYDGRLYRKLGVHCFKRFIVNFDRIVRLIGVEHPASRPIRTPTEAQRWDRHSRATEAAHLLHLILLCPAVVLAVSADRQVLAFGALMLLVLYDLYPILLQRYNRMRFLRVLLHRLQNVPSAAFPRD